MGILRYREFESKVIKDDRINLSPEEIDTVEEIFLDIKDVFDVEVFPECNDSFHYEEGLNLNIVALKNQDDTRGRSFDVAVIIRLNARRPIEGMKKEFEKIRDWVTTNAVNRVVDMGIHVSMEYKAATSNPSYVELSCLVYRDPKNYKFWSDHGWETL